LILPILDYLSQLLTKLFENDLL
jgi:hypothetical protein